MLPYFRKGDKNKCYRINVISVFSQEDALYSFAEADIHKKKEISRSVSTITKNNTVGKKTNYKLIQCV